MTGRLGLSRVAFGCTALDDIAATQGPFTNNGAVRLSSRRVPRRDLTGGRLFWIVRHTLVARQAIIEVDERPGPDGMIAIISLHPDVIPVVPVGYRAHQGWRYLPADRWPPDRGADNALPAELLADLRSLDLI